MVHLGAFFTLLLATAALARTCSSSSVQPSATSHDKPSATINLVLPSSSSPPMISYVTIFKTKTEFKYETVTVTKTVESHPSPGNPNSGKPTSVVKPNDEPTTTSKPPLQSSQILLPASVGPPASPTPSPTPTNGYPEDDDEDCEDGEDDDVSSHLPVSSSVKPNPSSSGYPATPEVTPPATVTTLPSSTVVKSPGSWSSSPVPASPSSVIPSPASLSSSTGAPKPTSTGKYDRNAICGNQKREPNPLELVPEFSKRDYRRRITY
ncbi:hypothetical protein BDM02DRAFT_3190430 [Thelephora ganbajun]|uniref:Uncharacterized protein n=1 Tax=Thelephora ganbajun TaxID=370292 RepID=A0ACB6Z5M8_THEGA|nr:hypothetical protein BDM02DRAFT_3190430 [Thelephora ganbajun]